jgi:hypothetical protein
MTRWIAGGILGLSVLATAACESSTTPRPPLILTPIDLGQFFSTSSGLSERGPITATNDAEWAALWNRIHAGVSVPPARPSVDFSVEVVVGYALGQKPTSGFAVELEDVSRERATVVVAAEETIPGSSCGVATVLTFPVAIARLTRTSEPIGFEVATTTRNCPP